MSIKIANHNVPFQVKANDAAARRVCAVFTEPISCDDIPKLRAKPHVLSTSSRHQGRVIDPEMGSWSWFELAIIPAYAVIDKASGARYETVKQADKLLSWVAFHHPVDQNGQVEKRFTHVFPENHEIWNYVQGGDRLAVFGCAQFPGWACYASQVELDTSIIDPPVDVIEPYNGGDSVSQCLTAEGTMTCVNNVIRLVFTVDGSTKEFIGTLSPPPLPTLQSKRSIIRYNKPEDLTGAYDFTGLFGVYEYSLILRRDVNSSEGLSVTGDTDQAVLIRPIWVGSGTWV